MKQSERAAFATQVKQLQTDLALEKSLRPDWYALRTEVADLKEQVAKAETDLQIYKSAPSKLQTYADEFVARVSSGASLQQAAASTLAHLIATAASEKLMPWERGVGTVQGSCPF